MDLTQTIAELEAQAAKFTEAANSLRALNGNNTAQSLAPQAKVDGRKNNPGRRKGSGKAQAEAQASAQPAVRVKRKSNMSAETRAKLSASMKARHDARKAAAAQSGGA